ncbi:hypothetical protein K2173_019994 [Erythroxylum novogranatense]|uniref:DNA-directed RNA polymerase n=1 Tax=Erythroxylum novogranatense TaxID=1862640 RepID=A0AAV8UAK0_9ROSI|nr:hypothetical protein K2173_019994 [Erythroxylum novogranatense]
MWRWYRVLGDGSCNGLQHYAALGRDKLGAAAVNLVAGEKPADVYSGIAARVLDIMWRDAEKDPAVFPDALRARMLVNQVTLTALGEMFEAARSIMNWLGECAKVMVKRQRTAFPPNFVHSLDGSHMMVTAVACKSAALNFAGSFELFSLRRFAISNYHCFIIEVMVSWVMIAGVHDSYCTHACDVDEMNRMLREKFVELYETPTLENVSLVYKQ